MRNNCYSIDDMMKKHFWKLVILAVVLLIAGSVVIAQQAAQKANEGVVVKQHIKGNENASVELVEYSDFQCPACGQFYPLVKEVVEEYGDDLRFEYRHFPLTAIHPYAAPAARASEAAGQQGKFWEMHDLLFENQSVWTRGTQVDAYFIQLAEQLELDIPTFRRQLGSSVINQAVVDDVRDAQDRGFTGTPTFLLNGKKMSFETYADFKKQIEDALGIVSTSTEDGGENTPSSPSEESGVKFGI